MKLFASFFAGNIVFAFLYAAVCWFTSRLDVTPYGRFMTAFFRGRTPEEAQAHIEANMALFERMMVDAAHFSNMVVAPSVGLVMGLVIGLIVSEKDWTAPLWWSFITVMPVTIIFWLWSAGQDGRAGHLLLLVAVVMAGAFIGNAISTRVLSGAAQAGKKYQGEKNK